MVPLDRAKEYRKTLRMRLVVLSALEQITLNLLVNLT